MRFRFVQGIKTSGYIIQTAAGIIFIKLEYDVFFVFHGYLEFLFFRAALQAIAFRALLYSLDGGIAKSSKKVISGLFFFWDFIILLVESISYNFPNYKSIKTNRMIIAPIIFIDGLPANQEKIHAQIKNLLP